MQSANVAPPDIELLQAARRHVPEAWDSLLKQHQLPLYAYVVGLLADESAALDVVQETFAAAVRNIASLRDDGRFAAWLFGIAHQKCIQHWRRVRRDQTVFAPESEETAIDWPGPDEVDPRGILLQREQAGEFFALVDRLPSVQRSALLLHVLEDFSLEEIAGITAVPVGTVKSRLHHAKRALRHLVETNLR